MNAGYERLCCKQHGAISKPYLQSMNAVYLVKLNNKCVLSEMAQTLKYEF